MGCVPIAAVVLPLELELLLAPAMPLTVTITPVALALPSLCIDMFNSLGIPGINFRF